MAFPYLLQSPAATRRIPVNPGDILLEPGFILEPLVIGLDYPTAIGIGEEGTVYLAEAGYSYGPGRTEGGGRILAVDLRTRAISVVAMDFKGPITSATWHRGALYVAEGSYPGRIWRVGPDGALRPLIEGLRSGADHFTGELVFGPDGFMYFGVGVATNAAVVGFDNFVFAWLPDMPDFHDIPARDHTMVGHDFASINPLEFGLNPSGSMVRTGGFKPFGAPGVPGEVIRGNLFANGVIYGANAEGGDLHVHADGLRNPFGLGFSLDGRLFAVDQGYDSRGSRPVEDAPDPMWQIQLGGWYGWPDYVAGEPVDQVKFTAPFAAAPPVRLIADPPPVAPGPVVNFIEHSATMKFDVSRNPEFGFVGEFFIAQFGTGTPVTEGEPTTATPGFRIVRVNPDRGQVNDFLVNARPGNPAGTGVARPIDCKFDPRGEILYVLDWGIMTGNLGGAIPWCGSGILWRIRRV